MSSIKLKNISKWFGNNLVIKNINLEIKNELTPDTWLKKEI